MEFLFFRYRTRVSLHDYSLTGSWLKDNNPFSLIPNKFRNIYQVDLFTKACLGKQILC